MGHAYKAKQNKLLRMLQNEKNVVVDRRVPFSVFFCLFFFLPPSFYGTFVSLSEDFVHGESEFSTKASVAELDHFSSNL